MDKYKVAFYIRLSVDENKHNSLSIENQREQLQNHIKTMEEFNNGVEVLEFVDNGYSGANFERTKVQELLELVRVNKVNCIIVKDFSRFGRNSIETGYFIEKVFPMFNIRFIAISDNFDSDNFKGDTGGIDVAFKYLVNEYYSRDLSMKVKSSVHSKMKKGEYRSSACIYGYKRSNGSYLEIDEEVADVVRLIFELKCDAASNTEIAKRLNDDKVPTPGEYKKTKVNFIGGFTEGRCAWTGDKIRKILNNEMYTGCYIVNRFSVREIGGKVKENPKDKWIKIPNHNPGIVDEEIFLKAHSNMKKITPKKAIGKGPKYLLRSKVACGVCKHNLDRRNKKAIYTCGYNLEQDNFYCNDIKVFEEDIENIIFAMIKKQAETILNTNVEVEKIDYSVLSEYEKEIDFLKNKKVSLYESFLRNEISIDEYKNNKTICDEKLVELKNIYDIQKTRANTFEELSTIGQKNTEFAEEVVSQNKLTEKLVDVLIDKVFVFPDNKIEVRWKSKDFMKIF